MCSVLKTRPRSFHTTYTYHLDRYVPSGIYYVNVNPERQQQTQVQELDKLWHFLSIRYEYEGPCGSLQENVQQTAVYILGRVVCM